MAAAPVHYHTTNAAVAPDGDLTMDACGAAGDSQSYAATVKGTHNSLLHARTNREGSLSLPLKTGGTVRMEAALGDESIPNGDGDVPFGDFFFQSLPPTDGVDNVEGEAVQHPGFDGFCFDDICGDGGWPAGDMKTGEVPREVAIDGDHQATPESFHFLLSDIPAATGTMSDGAFHFDSSLVQPTDVSPAAAAAVAPVPAPAASENWNHTTACEVKEIVQATQRHYHRHGRSKGNAAHEEGSLNRKDVKNVATEKLNQSRFSSGVNDGSTLALGAVPAAPRVLREGVEELLRRADHILCEGGAGDTAPEVPAAPPTTLGSGHGGNDTHSDAFFSAQVSHWLRRGAEVQESALSTASDLQLCLTQTLRLFIAHSGLSSALGPQYAATPVVLTLPLVLPLLESLLEED